MAIGNARTRFQHVSYVSTCRGRYFWTEMKAGASQCVKRPSDCIMRDWGHWSKCKTCTLTQRRSADPVLKPWGGGLNCSQVNAQYRNSTHSQEWAAGAWVQTRPCAGRQFSLECDANSTVRKGNYLQQLGKELKMAIADKSVATAKSIYAEMQQITETKYQTKVNALPPGQPFSRCPLCHQFTNLYFFRCCSHCSAMQSLRMEELDCVFKIMRRWHHGAPSRSHSARQIWWNQVPIHGVHQNM
jgi:hypothetical protein